MASSSTTSSSFPLSAAPGDPPGYPPPHLAGHHPGHAPNAPGAPADTSSTHHPFAYHSALPGSSAPGPGRKRNFAGSTDLDLTPTAPGGPAARGALVTHDPGAYPPAQHLPESAPPTQHASPSAASRHPPQHHPPDDDSAAVGTPNSTDGGASSAKKRKTARGSRGVANLTPEQLDRKRANDREAQRAIRERQRLRTEELERKIVELESTQPYLELQKARRETDAVKAELAEKERCLAAIMAMIQPVLGPRSVGPGPTQPCPSPDRSHPPAQPLPAPMAHHRGSTPTSATSPVSVSTHAPWQGGLSPGAPSVSTNSQHHSQVSSEMGVFHQQRYDLVHGLNLGSDRLGLDFLVEPNLKIARIQNGLDGAQDSAQYRHVPMKHDWTAAISMMPGQGQGQGQPQQQQQQAQHSPAYSHPSVATTATTPPFLPTPTTSTSSSAAHPPPFHTLVPRNCAPTCPLDSLLLDFLAERHQRAAEGLSQSEILGPRYPSVSSLLNPSTSAYSHPLSKVFTDILARFPDLHTLPERVGVLYAMFLLMRWQVAPTQENYLRLPPWFRPVRSQTEREHPAWYDHIPFPDMRDRLVRDYEPGEFPFENFFIPFTTTLSVNWPYEDAYVLLASPTGDELMINPVFEQHLGVLENWTLGPAFERAFPALQGSFNLRRGELRQSP